MSCLPSQGSPLAANVPPEVWIIIFEYLDQYQLCPARLTCHHWNQLIIGTPSLVAKFEIRFLHMFFPSDYVKRCRNLAASTLRFTKVMFANGTVNDSFEWWPLICENVIDLSFAECSVQTKSFLDILKHSPQIKALHFESINNFIIERNLQLSFKIPNLEKLSLVRPYVLQIFRQLCLRLKHLELRCLPKLLHENVTDHVVEFIENSRETLTVVDIDGIKGDTLSAILNIEELRLKRLKVLPILGEANPIRLNCKQPTIEKLEIGYTNSTQQLIHLGSKLPALKTFSVHLHERHLAALSFLTSMPALRWLTVRFSASSNLSFDNHTPCAYYHLARLSLSAAQYTLNWIAQFPNLRTLELTDCCVESWNDLFVQIEQMKKLQTLKLDGVRCRNKTPVVRLGKLEELRELRVCCSEMSSDVVKNFELSSPKLNRLHLDQRCQRLSL